MWVALNWHKLNHIFLPGVFLRLPSGNARLYQFSETTGEILLHHLIELFPVAVAHFHEPCPVNLLCPYLPAPGQGDFDIEKIFIVKIKFRPVDLRRELPRKGQRKTPHIQVADFASQVVACPLQFYLGPRANLPPGQEPFFDKCGLGDRHLFLFKKIKKTHFPPQYGYTGRID